MTKRVKTAILISDRGSNMQALLDACKQPNFPAEIVLVLSNNPNTVGLEVAEGFGIETHVVNHRDFSSRKEFDAVITKVLEERGVELVCLAGFMRLLSEEFIQTWRNRLINIHPSLLPAFTGLNTHERAIERGVKFTGCTVHYVRHEVDTGPIIAQAVVPVLAEDTPDTLAARILVEEHKIYPHALKLVASGAVRVEGEKLISISS